MRRTRSCEVYIDGASRGNPGPSGIGVVVMGLPAAPSARHAKHRAHDGQSAAPAGGTAGPARQLSIYLGETTNNVAEYLALVYALQEALKDGYTEVVVKTDSELLARQINGQYRVRDPQLRLFHGLAVHLAKGFHACLVEHIPRIQNRLADRLAGQAVRRAAPTFGTQDTRHRTRSTSVVPRSNTGDTLFDN